MKTPDPSGASRRQLGELRRRLIELEGVAERLRRTEQALRDSEQLYRTTIEALDEYVHVVDRRLRIELFNTAFVRWCRQLGLDTDVVGRGVFEVFPFLPARVRREYRRVFRTGQPVVTQEVVALGRRHISTETHKLPIYDRGRVLWVATIIRDITEQKRAQQALRDAHMKLLGAREAERRRLARELHDTIGQRLIAAGLKLRGVLRSNRRADPPAALVSLSQEVQELIEEVRRISHGLYPPALEQVGLCAALRELKPAWQSPRVRVVVRCSATTRRARFDPAVEIAAFRIAQEAVANAVRHGRPKRVDVSLGVSKGSVRLRVTNDGRRFDPDSALGKGLGLISMRDRAEAVGGTVSIASRPQRTVVEALLPIGRP